MPNVAEMRDIGAYLKPTVGVKPTNDDGAAPINGAAIDRTGFESCVLFTVAGAAAGTPTAQTVDAKLQESDDGSTGWTDIADAAITQVAADDGSARVNVDLSGAKKFIRVVQTVTVAGGTSPTWSVASNVILGGAVEVPA